MNLDVLRNAMGRSQASWEISAEPIDVSMRLGYLPSRGVPPIEEQEQIALSSVARHEEAMGAAAPPYPPACDLRDREGRNYITPIRDQGQCTSCVAFGSCAAVEGTLLVQQDSPGREVDLSEAQLFYCVALAQGRSCEEGPRGGWYPKEALEAFQAQGVPDEACFPYTPGDQACAACSDWEAGATRIAQWQPLDTPLEMKQWICAHGPVVASMQVYEDFQHYAGDIYRHVAGGPLGGHCICIVGYDDEGGYWIAKNSWNTGWGEQGFFKIAYGECGIDSGMLGVEGVTFPQT
jgi:C1A family cysteine protease